MTALGVQRLFQPPQCCKSCSSGGTIHLEIWHSSHQRLDWEEHPAGSGSQPGWDPRSLSHHWWNSHIQWKAHSHQDKLDQDPGIFLTISWLLDLISDFRKLQWCWRRLLTKFVKLWDCFYRVRDTVSTSGRMLSLSKHIFSTLDNRQPFWS